MKLPYTFLIPVFMILVLVFSAPARAADADADTYGKNEILDAAHGFFGATTQGLAKAVGKIFEDHGRPNAYIAGEEAGGAIGVGLTYGDGRIHTKKWGSRKVYWQSPSIGFDLGGNASRVFALVYDLKSINQIFQRFPGVKGSYYFVAGLGVTYHRTQGVVVAPIRTGVGLRAGVNVNYVHFTRKKSWIPF